MKDETLTSSFQVMQEEFGTLQNKNKVSNTHYLYKYRISFKYGTPSDYSTLSFVGLQNTCMTEIMVLHDINLTFS